MELLPNLRRFSKRSLLCLYFACAMFLACAFYTLHTESYAPFPDPSIINDDSATILDIKNLISEEPIGKIVPPAVAWTPLTPNSTDDTVSEVPHNLNATVGTKPESTSKAVQPETKYVYLTNSPSGSTRPVKATSNFPKGLTQVPLPLDTCQTFSMNNSKLILQWTSFFGEWGYLSQKKFRECRRCRNCQITRDRSKLHESDAVVFHARDMSLSDLPPVRYPHQRWIFYCLESPPYSDFPGMAHMLNMFNWTMSYRRDSDIVTQYGTVTRIHPSRKLDRQSLQMSFNNKSKSVVWMSSHCPTHGGRDDYVAELRKYIDVDVYGTCGTSMCPPNGTQKCLRDFAKRYKFFLAFENTICKDYVTEKFFRTLEYNMIPVVFGGAPYAKFAPPGSYIDALSFKSPKHLAFFLAGIGNDFKMYSTYFMWRQDYVVDTTEHRECDMCALLHRRDLKSSSYGDLRKWWVGNGTCRTWRSNG